MADRYFTLEEAQGMVGWLEETFKTLTPLRERAIQLSEEFKELQRRTRTNGGGDVSEQLASRRSALKEASEQIEAKIKPIRERGIVVKNIEQGLVDFPCMREGRVVFLCWLAGEPDIGYWHELAAGFAGRQPL